MTQRFHRPIALTLAALALAGAATGCSAEQKETARQLCQEHPAECADLVKDLNKVPAGQPGTSEGQPPAQPPAQVTPQQVTGDQVPAEPAPPVPGSTPPLPPGQGRLTRDQVWSQNFRVTRPRLLNDGKLFLEGTARAFEAMFQVEVWSGDTRLLTQSVMAAAGGPDFGRFEVTLTVPGGVPAGAEVRYQIQSMKDGSVTTELTLPVSQ